MPARSRTASAARAIARPLLDMPLPRAAGPNDLTGRNDLSAIVREDLGSILLDRSETLREVGRLAEAQDRRRAFFRAALSSWPDDDVASLATMLERLNTTLDEATRRP